MDLPNNAEVMHFDVSGALIFHVMVDQSWPQPAGLAGVNALVIT